MKSAFQQIYNRQDHHSTSSDDLLSFINSDDDTKPSIELKERHLTPHISVDLIFEKLFLLFSKQVFQLTFIHMVYVIYDIYDIYDIYGALAYTICVYVNMGVKH